MNTLNIKKVTVAILSLWCAFVLLQSLFFKFAENEETVIIFSTISDWINDIFTLPMFAEIFRYMGGYVIGLAELLAVFLLIFTKTRNLGFSLIAMIMAGAIFFHLFTPLGVDRIINEAGDTDGGALFYMACSVKISALLALILNRKERHYF